MTRVDRQSARQLAAVLLAGALARALYLAAFVRTPLFEFYRNDHLFYREWALRIAGGGSAGSAPFEQGPLYAYLLGALYRLLGSREALVLGLQLLAGLCTVGLIFWCARRAWGGGAALAAGALAALYGPFIFYEAMIMKTFLEPLLVLAALAAALRALESGRARWYAAAGAAVGLSCLVREVHVLLLVPLLFAARLPVPPAPLPLSRRLRGPGAALLGCALALAPSFARNWAVAREPVAVSSAGGQNLYIAFGPYATGYYTLPPFATSLANQEHEDFREEAFLRTGRHLTRGDSSRYWLRETLQWVRGAPGRTAALVGMKAAILFNDVELPDSEDFTVTRGYIPLLRLLPTFGSIAGLGLLGFFLLWRRRGAARPTAGFAATLIVEVLLTFNLGRYRAALAGAWLLSAGVGLAWLTTGNGGRGRAGGRLRIAGAAAAVVVSTLAFRDPPGRDPARLTAMHDLFRRQAEGAVPHRRRIPELRAALAASPGDPALLYELGVSLDGIGSIGEAVRAYEATLAAVPDAPAPRSRLIAISSRSGETERALEHARALAALQPGDAASWAALGTLLARTAERSPAAGAQALIEEATADLLRAAALDPRNIESRYWLGRTFLLAGQGERALRELEAAGRIAATLVRPREYQAADHLARLVRERFGRGDTRLRSEEGLQE